MLADLQADEIALTLSKACGHWGSCADYLHQTVLSLDAAGIHDGYLWDLQERVAALIEAQIGPRVDLIMYWSLRRDDN